MFLIFVVGLPPQLTNRKRTYPAYDPGILCSPPLLQWSVVLQVLITSGIYQFPRLRCRDGVVAKTALVMVGESNDGKFSSFTFPLGQYEK